MHCFVGPGLLNGVSLAQWADGGTLLVVFRSSLPSSTKKTLTISELSELDPLRQKVLDPRMLVTVIVIKRHFLNKYLYSIGSMRLYFFFVFKINTSRIYVDDLAPVKCIYPSQVAFEGCGSVVVDLLFIVALIVCGSLMFGPCFVMQYQVSFLVSQSNR